jgi:hypothetical protein
MSESAGTSLSPDFGAVDINLADAESTASAGVEPQSVSFQAFFDQARRRPLAFQRMLPVLELLDSAVEVEERLEWAALARRARNRFCKENP